MQNTIGKIVQMDKIIKEVNYFIRYKSVSRNYLYPACFELINFIGCLDVLVSKIAVNFNQTFKIALN